MFLDRGEDEGCGRWGGGVVRGVCEAVWGGGM